MPAQDKAPSSPAESSTSDGSTESVSTAPPRTPVSSAPPVPMPIFMNFTGEDTIKGVGGVRSKTTRRINTAERRATHNAVERQRRETLNGRFMDLAAMLSNLRDIRRPSKSLIVNSSIAHLHASHRHRIIAAQQLRMLKEETDALRHEANAWCLRAGAPFIEEPMRDESFGVVLSGELEFEAADMLPGDASEDEESGEQSPCGATAPRNVETLSTDEYALLQRRQLEHAEMLEQAYHAQVLQQHAHIARAGMHPSVSSHSFPPEYEILDAPPQYYTPAPAMAGLIPAAGFENPAMANGCDCAECTHPHPALAAKWAQERMLLAHHQELLEQRRGT
ncbi:BHLH domain-containing protein [Mycena venus]|uniref:BHLH domain-containing protein n=1 Tax=Mycena venus TaxID=2733690 RepID=A0A8H6XJP3_9AGAR|nr:BHLH domain-containing protein [Mycena venus]